MKKVIIIFSFIAWIGNVSAQKNMNRSILNEAIVATNEIYEAVNAVNAGVTLFSKETQKYTGSETLVNLALTELDNHLYTLLQIIPNYSGVIDPAAIIALDHTAERAKHSALSYFEVACYDCKIRLDRREVLQNYLTELQNIVSDLRIVIEANTKA